MEFEDVNKERDEAVKEKRDWEREATREKKKSEAFSKEIRKLYVEKIAMETKQLELQDQLVTQEKESQVAWAERVDVVKLPLTTSVPWSKAIRAS
ncbi:hypothetical protein OEA41_009489 [Lepraria neglecta]|uniref:Uncharacterized protein n=1 Tax=Lepraria neglecta TaxID=209136 RepID=A0AAD9Z3N4_9LECA|nr:hypothetical protein OEA41_009489 [Lepraria neglecta]